MIGLLILAPRTIGNGLIEAASDILGRRPPLLEVIPIDGDDRGPEQITAELEHYLQRFDQGQGVLVLADIFGASHTNAVCRLLCENRLELVSGVNLPMLIRALNHRHLGLAELAAKAASGGTDGIVCASERLRAQGKGAT